MAAITSTTHAHAETGTCLHCGNTTPARGEDFCCSGCKIVYGLLRTQHLERYYELRGERGVPVPDVHIERRDRKWLEPIEARRRQTQGAARVDLDIQGLHCSACVWLIDTIFARSPDAMNVIVNPSLGRVQLFVGPRFDLAAFVADVEQLGYLLGPPLKHAETRASELAVRMGICIALAMNAMIFAVATYAGLHDGPTYTLLVRWNLGISIASVAIGGSVFFKSAWRALRRGALHLDLPIALGIALAFAGSLYGYAANRPGGIFIDTLDVFIALMLVGRFLQERVLERNRLALLASDGVDGLLARRVREGNVETVRCTELQEGDAILVAPGDLVPLDAAMAPGARASFSLDWINGESRARTYEAEEMIPAGAFLSSTTAVTLLARQSFADSPLIDLLRAPATREADTAMSAPWWRRVAKWYVFMVLVAAVVGFAGWMIATHDFARSLEVATAVLIVTCPCSFGIATPLAYDLVQAGLRRAGLYVRSAGFLDRAERVERVVFDKTGTLTSGALRLADASPLDALSVEQLGVLASMVAVSAHPKSVALQRALADRGVALAPAADVHEHAGQGLSRIVDGVEYRLGKPSWVASAASAKHDVAFGANAQLLAALCTEEPLRPDASTEVRALQKTGYDVWLLSGDDFARAAQTARAVGIAPSHTLAGFSADAKAAWLAAHDHHNVLMIGDGINDSLAVARAFCGGTPAIDRPFMAARSDFYFVTPGLRCIRLALRAAKRVGEVRRRNLVLALAYNVLAVSLAYAGWMSPLVCAVFMPASSLTTILATTFSLNARSSLWRS